MTMPRPNKFHAKREALARHVIQSRAGGRVERCHNIPHQGSYSVAAHSWGVAMLMWYLWPADFPRLSIYCLSHDVPEAWTGDIPAPVMRYVTGLAQSIAEVEARLQLSLGLPDEGSLSAEDHLKLKSCDRLDFWLWAREQVTMGNGFAREGLQEIERYFTDENALHPDALLLWNVLKDITPIPRQQGVLKEMFNVSK